MNMQAPETIKLDANKPINLTGKFYLNNRWACYKYMREHLPVHKVKMVGIGIYATARYEDCLTVLKDERFARNRTKVTGGSRFPVPLPANLRLVGESMIVEDDPEHRRLRQLVQKAFSPKALKDVEERVTLWAHDLADECVNRGEFRMQADFSQPIPMRAIAQMMGIDEEAVPIFAKSVRTLTEGFNGWRIARTLLWDLRQGVGFVRELVKKKRNNPGDDILSRLIHAEEDGDNLTENEVISMVFLLIVAGFETTTNLISNGVRVFAKHPDQWQRLKERPELIGPAVEELLRHSGPVHGTKMNYAKEDIELGGVLIPKGAPVMPFLGSANRDESFFEDPDVFDIGRKDNKHLSFAQGNHFCLGAFLARMEARISFQALLQRTNAFELVDEPEISNMPGWYRYKDYRVRIR